MPWKPPVQGAGSCTQAQLDALVAYIDANPNATAAGMQTSIGPDLVCRTCIFGPESDPTWTPLLIDVASNDLTRLNVGGCIAIASGSETCGRSYQNWYDCRFEACADCDEVDGSAFQRCLVAATKGACKGAYTATVASCGDPALSAADAACNGDRYIFEGPVKAQCIGGIP